MNIAANNIDVLFVIACLWVGLNLLTAIIAIGFALISGRNGIRIMPHQHCWTLNFMSFFLVVGTMQNPNASKLSICFAACVLLWGVFVYLAREDSY